MAQQSTNHLLDQQISIEDGVVNLPSAEWVTDAEFSREGDDLVLTLPNGQSQIVENYFNADPTPDLVFTNEAGIESRLPSGLVDSFLVKSPNLADATDESGTISLNDAITPIAGRVETVSGEVFAIRINGERVQLQAGDPVYQNDIIETGDKGSLKLKFIDDTLFSLGENAKLAIDQMVFDPNSETGETALSILKGSFLFVSGKIAKTDPDDMVVVTPVATIGIRGTVVAGEVSPESGFNFSVIDGAIAVEVPGNPEPFVLSDAFATLGGTLVGDGQFLTQTSISSASEVISRNARQFSTLNKEEVELIEEAVIESAAENGDEVASLGMVELVESASAEIAEEDGVKEPEEAVEETEGQTQEVTAETPLEEPANLDEPIDLETGIEVLEPVEPVTFTDTDDNGEEEDDLNGTGSGGEDIGTGNNYTVATDDPITSTNYEVIQLGTTDTSTVTFDEDGDGDEEEVYMTGVTSSTNSNHVSGKEYDYGTETTAIYAYDDQTADDDLKTGSGDDIIFSNGGQDIISTDGGNDVVTVASGYYDDFNNIGYGTNVQTGTGNDIVTVASTAHIDEIQLGEGDDVLELNLPSTSEIGNYFANDYTPNYGYGGINGGSDSNNDDHDSLKLFATDGQTLTIGQHATNYDINTNLFTNFESTTISSGNGTVANSLTINQDLSDLGAGGHFEVKSDKITYSVSSALSPLMLSDAAIQGQININYLELDGDLTITSDGSTKLNITDRFKVSDDSTITLDLTGGSDSLDHDQVFDDNDANLSLEMDGSLVIKVNSDMTFTTGGSGFDDYMFVMDYHGTNTFDEIIFEYEDANGNSVSGLDGNSQGYDVLIPHYANGNTGVQVFALSYGDHSSSNGIDYHVYGDADGGVTDVTHDDTSREAVFIGSDNKDDTFTLTSGELAYFDGGKGGNDTFVLQKDVNFSEDLNTATGVINDYEINNIETLVLGSNSNSLNIANTLTANLVDAMVEDTNEVLGVDNALIVKVSQAELATFASTLTGSGNGWSSAGTSGNYSVYTSTQQVDGDVISLYLTDQ